MTSKIFYEANWDQLLETPPGWMLKCDDQDKQPEISEENDIISEIQPSTFDFLNDENEIINLKTFDKSKQKMNTFENGTYVIKLSGFVADSVKFEYVYNEIPSRCIMLSNIPPFASKSDLIYVFNCFGTFQSCDISNLSKGVASVMFYSMEDAQMMRVSTIYICNQKVMKIFYADAQENELKKLSNNGTIVLFHVPKEISESELYVIFSKFGKIRQIRSTPMKDYQKFIEFYDIRSAEKALKTYNGKQLSLKSNSRVSIEFSRPGGYKKNIQKYYKTKLPTIERSKNNNKKLF